LERVGSIAKAFRPIHQLLLNKYYIDEIYGALFIRPTMRLAQGLDWFDYQVIDRVFVDGFGWTVYFFSQVGSWLDDHLVDGIVNGTGELASGLGGLARRVQNGWVQNYLLVITIGFVALVLWKLF
jgi:NADH-quinone oxidoreductase subunit L